MITKSDYSQLNIKTLKRLCKSRQLTGYSRMLKIELINFYNKFLAVRLIQRNFRKYFYKDAVDSITLEPVNYPCFIYRVKTGQLFFYDYNSIIKYIMKSGRVIDPNTRNEYTDFELIRLDAQAKLHFPDKNFKSTYKIKKNENYAKRIRNRENDILTFQLRLDEIQSCIILIITDEIMTWNLNETLIIENIQYRNFNEYVNSIIHELRILFLNLKTYSEFEARCFKQHFLEKIGDSSRYFYDIINRL